MQYWINQNGVQAGPVTRDELERMNVSADAYVWRSGLEDWVKITSLPELEGVIGAPVVPQPAVAQPVEEPVAEPVAEEEPVAEPVAENPVEQPSEPAPEQPAAIPPIPEQPAVVVGTPVAGYYQPQPRQYPQPRQEERPECPPTNLVWAIIVTLLCCTVMGIVAIIYAIKVRNRYNYGDYKGALRASETGAWWCIGSIIASIVLSPISFIVQMLMM